MSQQRYTDRWIQGVRRWLIGYDVDGEQLAFPGMPEPPKAVAMRALPPWLVTYANADGTGCRPTRANLARLIGTTERVVQQCTTEYERFGLIGRVGKAHRGQAQEWLLVDAEWLPTRRRKGEATDSLSREKGRSSEQQREKPQTPHHKETSSGVVDAPVGARVDTPAETPRTRPRLDTARWRLPDECAHGNIRGDCDPCEALTDEKKQQQQHDAAQPAPEASDVTAQ